MNIAIDVQYNGNVAVVAGVLFEAWSSTHETQTIVTTVDNVAPYQSGAFYKRELPCILALLNEIDKPLSVIVIDGYVTLGKEETPGLGWHLYQELAAKADVIGVAKKPFKGTPVDCELRRGKSNNPLYITAAGMSLDVAKCHIKNMHGEHRLPKMLKMADQLCRGIKV